MCVIFCCSCIGKRSKFYEKRMCEASTIPNLKAQIALLNKKLPIGYYAREFFGGSNLCETQQGQDIAISCVCVCFGCDNDDEHYTIEKR